MRKVPEVSKLPDPILRIPESIRQETAAHRDKVAAYLAGDTSEVAFRAYRVPMGIYEQRTTGKFMVRVRIGAGLVLPDQLRRIAELSGTYGSGIIHATTRQDIQIHDVNIEDTPDVLEKLLEAGLSSRGGGGNTVRNVTACPRSGVCPDARFDVAPYAVAAAEYLLADNSSFNLPRKYKIVFSACAGDCAFASVADLGFFANRKDGIDGFVAYAAGGLGSSPAVAIKIEEFVPASDIFEVAEAIKRVFDKHGDRVNRHKARLRYVVARLGVEKFRELYRAEREVLKSDGLPYPAPEIRDIESRFSVGESAGDASATPGVMPEATPGRVTVRVRPTNGDISADDLARIAAVSASYGQGLVRVTQLQNVLISGVACGDVETVLKELDGLNTEQSGPNMVACTGAAMCKLGLCLSRGLSDAIVARLGAVAPSPDGSQTTIRISGCPNSCANHYLPDIAFQGRAKRVGGKLMPFYNVLTGAVGGEGETRLGRVVGCVPAKRVPDMVLEAWSDGKVDASRLEQLADKYGQVDADSLPDDYCCDFGSDEPFSLAGRG